MNTRLRKNNTSGIKGVYRSNNKWIATIQKNKKRKYLGIFDNFDDAVFARQQAEKKFFGNFRFEEATNE